MGRIAALGVLAAVVVAGYGSTRTVAVAGGKAPGKAWFIARADSICSSANRRVAPLTTAIWAALPGSLPAAHAAIAKHVAKVEAIEFVEATRLRTLVPPKGHTGTGQLQLGRSRPDLRLPALTVQEVIVTIARTLDTNARALPIVVAALEDAHISPPQAETNHTRPSPIGRRIEAYGFKACGSAL